MSQTRESRPEANQAAGITCGDTDSLRPSDDLDRVRGFIEGVHVVVVETPTGKHRQRMLISLINAQLAATAGPACLATPPTSSGSQLLRQHGTLLDRPQSRCQRYKPALTVRDAR